jgi:hypothetical protein
LSFAQAVSAAWNATVHSHHATRIARDRDRVRRQVPQVLSGASNPNSISSYATEALEGWYSTVAPDEQRAGLLEHEASMARVRSPVHL